MTAAPTVAVVGGGPGGLFAAERLAGAGCAVTVYEHMPSVGRKLLLAGRSGLNLTHAEPFDAVLARYGAAAPVLESALRAFPPAALRAWCEGLGQATFVGSSGRVFPEAFRATPLLRAWLARLSELGVELRVQHRWHGWGPAGSLLMSTRGGDPFEVRPDAVVLATGGASWPRTGSDGAWLAALVSGGVRVDPFRPANCGYDVAWSAPFAERFAGVPVKNVVARAEGAPPVRGEAMITRHGIEGSPVYVLGPALRAAFDRNGAAVLHLDLHPDLTAEALADRLGRRRAGDSLATALRRVRGLAPVSGPLLREDRRGDPVPADPHGLAARIKDVQLRLTAARPIERAISTAGGVALDELDTAFMLRRRPGTFAAGEMLSWEAPTGGYLLQATFSTAFAAAEGCLAWLAAGRPGAPQ